MEKAKAQQTVELKIDGLAEDEGAVGFSVFREKLDTLGRLLSESERHVENTGQAKSNFLVTDLKKSSAYISLEPYAKDDYSGSINAVDFLADVLKDIDSETESLRGVKSSLVKKIEDICKGSGDKFSEQVLLIGGNKFTLNEALADKARKYLDQKYEAYG